MKKDESATGMKNVSVYLCYLLRHHPEDVGLEMDTHGWVSVDDLIYCISKRGKYTLKPVNRSKVRRVNRISIFIIGVDGIPETMIEAMDT